MTSRHTVTLTVERGGHEIEVEVVATYTFSREEGRSIDYPQGGAPESEDIEIESVEPDVELTSREVEAVYEKVAEQASE